MMYTTANLAIRSPYVHLKECHLNDKVDAFNTDLLEPVRYDNAQFMLKYINTSDQIVYVYRADGTRIELLPKRSQMPHSLIDNLAHGVQIKQIYYLSSVAAHSIYRQATTNSSVDLPGFEGHPVAKLIKDQIINNFKPHNHPHLLDRNNLHNPYVGFAPSVDLKYYRVEITYFIHYTELRDNLALLDEYLDTVFTLKDNGVCHPKIKSLDYYNQFIKDDMLKSHQTERVQLLSTDPIKLYRKIGNKVQVVKSTDPLNIHDQNKLFYCAFEVNDLGQEIFKEYKIDLNDLSKKTIQEMADLGFYLTAEEAKLSNSDVEIARLKKEAVDKEMEYKDKEREDRLRADEIELRYKRIIAELNTKQAQYKKDSAEIDAEAKKADAEQKNKHSSKKHMAESIAGIASIIAASATIATVIAKIYFQPQTKIVDMAVSGTAALSSIAIGSIYNEYKEKVSEAIEATVDTVTSTFKKIKDKWFSWWS